MKTAIYKMMVLVVLLAIPATILYAQPTGTWFKVPFPFTVGDKAMPAGEYFVEALYWNAVAFHRSDGKAVLVTIARSGEPRNVTTPKLVFRNYGDVYFLAEVQSMRTQHARSRQARKKSSSPRHRSARRIWTSQVDSKRTQRITYSERTKPEAIRASCYFSSSAKRLRHASPHVRRTDPSGAKPLQKQSE